MEKRKKLIVGAVAVVALVSGGSAIAVASGDDDASDTAITGSALQQATDAALAHTGGGTVTGTEVDDEESKYEVEVTRADGSQIDVQLDENFEVVSDEAETEGEDD